MLLFLLPGALGALTPKVQLTVMALAIALASVPCMALMQLSAFQHLELVQAIAFITSAVFCCGSGKLAVILGRTLL